MERYKIVNHIEFDTYYVGSPIQIDRGNILLDSTTGGLLMQLKLTNVSEKTVKAVYLTVDYYDVSGEPVQSGVNVNFLGLTCGKGASCGTNMPVKLPNNDVFNVRLHIKKVVFADDTAADVSGEEMAIPEQKRIFEEWGAIGIDAAKNLLNDSMEFIPKEFDNGVWICGCGRANEGEACVKCHIRKDKVFQIITADGISAEMNRLEKLHKEQERAEQEYLEYSKQIDAENEECSKTSKKFVLICGAAVIVIAAIIVLSEFIG